MTRFKMELYSSKSDINCIADFCLKILSLKCNYLLKLYLTTNFSINDTINVDVNMFTMEIGMDIKGSYSNKVH